MSEKKLGQINEMTAKELLAGVDDGFVNMGEHKKEVEGARLSEIDGNELTFIVPSVTADEKEYEDKVVLLDLPAWVKLGREEGLSWPRIAQEAMAGQILVNCTCDAFCFVGETKVTLLDGSIRMMKELTELYDNKKFWVYSVDEKGDFVPAQAQCKKTGRAKEFVEVILNNNKSIQCTPEHLFMMRDGSWKMAQDLREGDSLMPLYFMKKRLYGKGSEYLWIKINSQKKLWRAVHRVAAEYVSGETKTKDCFGSYKGFWPEDKCLMIQEVEQYHSKIECNNHRVISVRKVKGEAQDIYDLSVEGTHNFLLDAGVIVHNCYWGYKYVLTQLDAVIQGEDRFPGVRNPKVKGTICKHLYLTLRALPFYASDLASHLKKAYGKTEEKLVEATENTYRIAWQAIQKIITIVDDEKQYSGISFMLVDGDKVKEEHDMDFVEGGNWLVYDFIPEGQVWIDNHLQPEECAPVAFHEFVEIDQMQSFGKDYDEAHEVANKWEKEARIGKLNNKGVDSVFTETY